MQYSEKNGANAGICLYDLKNVNPYCLAIQTMLKELKSPLSAYDALQAYEVNMNSEKQAQIDASNAAKAKAQAESILNTVVGNTREEITK